MSTKLKNTNKGLSSFYIRLIGVATMVCYFLCNSKLQQFRNPAIADCMLWLSYTIFAFILVEGIFNTSNRRLYITRFFVFTALSEVAFDYYTFGKPWVTSEQSIMCTLYLCLLIMFLCDYINRRFKNSVLNIIFIVVLTLISISFATRFHFQFGRNGILIAMLFYSAYNLTYPKLYEIALMGAYAFGSKSETFITVTIDTLQYSLPIVLFAIIGLLITWLYNGKRGPNALVLKVIYYLIYPALLVGFFLLEKYLLI